MIYTEDFLRAMRLDPEAGALALWRGAGLLRLRVRKDGVLTLLLDGDAPAPRGAAGAELGSGEGAEGAELGNRPVRAWPDGREIHRFERELAARLGLPGVELELPPARGAARWAEEGRLASAVAWLAAEIRDEQPIVATVLDELGPEACRIEPAGRGAGGVGQDGPLGEDAPRRLVLCVPDACAKRLSEELKARVLDFFRRRCGFVQLTDLRLEVSEDTESEEAALERYWDDYKRFTSTLKPAAESAPAQGAAGKAAEKVKTSAPGQAPPGPRMLRGKQGKDLLWGRMYALEETAAIPDLNAESGLVHVEGEIHNPEIGPTRAGTKLIGRFTLEAGHHGLRCFCLAKLDKEEELRAALQAGRYVRVEADIRLDRQHSQDLCGKVDGIRRVERPVSPRRDRAEEKRVELHCHTKMSVKDALCDVEGILRRAADFGHEALAITDHGCVQAFPEAFAAVQAIKREGRPLKLIYGVEAYLVDDGPTCVFGFPPHPSGDEFVALDVETTGLDAVEERLIEVAALRYVRGEDGVFRERESLVSLINPERSLSEKSAKLTGITDLDLLTAPTARDFLPRLHAFIGDSPVLGHNGLFDLAFLRAEAFRGRDAHAGRLKFNPCLIDTLRMARCFLPNLPSYRLDRVAQALNVGLDSHHRALDDARCAAEIYLKLQERLGFIPLEEINRRAGQLPKESFMAKAQPRYHLIILARNSLGLYNLYRLISESHVNYVGRRPLMPRSLVEYLRAGLLLGSACEAGEVFREIRRTYAACGRDLAQSRERLGEEAMKRLGRFYDYLEVQPLCNNRFLLNNEQNGLLYESDLKNLNFLVLELGKICRLPVVATCDVHFIEPEDGYYRKIMLTNMGYKDMDMQADLYFRSTEEMLDEFSYFPEEERWAMVIDNPRRIAALVEDGLRPFPSGSFPPEIPEADERVQSITYARAAELYDAGEGLPAIVAERIERELHSIISNGFAIMYYIAHRVVRQSNEDGYIVGSRGSVGSSLVATLCGITEVNPLPPHYFCKACRYSEFDTSGRYGSGYDLPPKDCPRCGAALIREGQDIPFATFLGFEGDKQPDIDLNFSGEYQSRAHLFIEEMFGHDYTFRAGTISAYAEKNALGLVKAYLEAQGETMSQASIDRLARAFVGVKRTTGQHPGGIVVIPKDREIYEFTPLQFPADNTGSAMQTTHFDFNALHDTILKLDILGHDDPTVLHMLAELTGVDIADIPIPDERVMSMFRSTEALGFVRQTEQVSSTLGIPEMGTMMARDMIMETQPSRFYDLVQLMGLSHGTDVWKGNAQELIRKGVCDINQVIGCRDSIMTSLIYKGLPSKAAFDIMEKVRKGKGLSEEHEKLMREHQVEDWYIDSCKKIKYMFPKAHAVAYAISSLRVAWFKIYHPAAYYAAYFTVRADEFDSSLMCVPYEEVVVNRRQYERLLRQPGSSSRDKNIFYILELVEEMHNRGIRFEAIDLMRSDAARFLPTAPDRIRPPFDVIPGFSRSMGQSLVAAREAGGAFHNREELAQRAGLGPSAVAALAEAGVLEGLPESAQISLFEWMEEADVD